jgi:L-fucose isomerase-like protein
MIKGNPPTLGVIYGNRDFFPDHLVTEARADIAKLFQRLDIKAIQLDERIPSSAASKRSTTPQVRRTVSQARR